MKYGVFSALIISVLWGILAIAQLWFSPLSSEIFTKVTISAGILVAIIVLSTIVIREFLADQKLRNDAFLD